MPKYTFVSNIHLEMVDNTNSRAYRTIMDQVSEVPNMDVAFTQTLTLAAGQPRIFDSLDLLYIRAFYFQAESAVAVALSKDGNLFVRNRPSKVFYQEFEADSPYVGIELFSPLGANLVYTLVGA